MRGESTQFRSGSSDDRGVLTVAVTESDGTVGDDLAKREAPRRVQYRAQAQGEVKSGEGATISVT